MQETKAFHQRKQKTLSLAYIAMFAAIIAVCSWISIPSAIPFTMQTFGVFLAVGMLGGKRGTLSVLVYLVLGMLGLPVFASFNGGLGYLLGVTGGYIIGFLFSALAMWGLEKLLGKKTWALAVSMVVGLLVCYAFGTGWYMIAHVRNSDPVGLWTALGGCVIPFLIPDGIKILLALLVSKKCAGFLKQN